MRGPPAKSAYDAAGKPTRALEGYCKKNGVALDSVTVEADAKGVQYVYASIKDAGRSAAEVGGGGVGEGWGRGGGGVGGGRGGRYTCLTQGHL